MASSCRILLTDGLILQHITYQWPHPAAYYLLLASSCSILFTNGLPRQHITHHWPYPAACYIPMASPGSLLLTNGLILQRITHQWPHPAAYYSPMASSCCRIHLPPEFHPGSSSPPAASYRSPPTNKIMYVQLYIL